MPVTKNTSWVGEQAVPAEARVPKIDLLDASEDAYEGVIVDMKEPMNSDLFVSALRASTMKWREQVFFFLISCFSFFGQCNVLFIDWRMGNCSIVWSDCIMQRFGNKRPLSWVQVNWFWHMILIVAISISIYSLHPMLFIMCGTSRGHELNALKLEVRGIDF